ncbi:hypothetical protein F5X68DRAFT_235972 [Plectosphaerella plurivora]|uniref:BHLH domain-containing protein n=1 Tax=Plectosphaerella plurivora TaxID=936078 RepID=A0A9P8V3W3_9PEZI|nr:hypothetical protein F5X68DRAFT_235972 [Plectosphaerella plurivora]
MPVPDPSPDSNHQGPHAHAAAAPGTQTPDPGLVQHPILHPSSLQSAPDWFLLDSSAPGPAAPFLQPVDPFLAPSGSNIANFALGIHGHDFHYPEGTHEGAILPHHLSLSDPSSAINFDFNFPLPQWEPSFVDRAHLPDVSTDEAHAFGGLRRPEADHAMGLEAFAPEVPWFDDDQTSLTADHPSSHTFTTPARAVRKRNKKNKGRTDSTASTSAYSASVTSTQDAFPFPTPISNPSNPLNHPPSNNTERRQSNRNKGRARSVATTTSASSSSTAPTPSVVSGTRSQPPPAAAAAARPPEQSPNSATSASRLRSASRASKNSVSRPSDTAEERRTRASHNLVEKQYRSRLNAQFEGLLGVLPDPDLGQAENIKTEAGVGTPAPPADTEQDPGDKKVSKAEVLERARVHIETLERQSEALARQREALLKSLVEAEGEMASSGGADHGLLENVDDGEEFPLERWETKQDKEHEDNRFGEKSSADHDY